MFNIYVTVSDGQLNSKVEVPVTIVRAGGNNKPNYSGGYRPGLNLPPTFQPNASNVTNLFPAFSSLPGVTGGGNKNPNQRPNPFQTHTYPRPPNGYNEPTEIGGSGSTATGGDGDDPSSIGETVNDSKNKTNGSFNSDKNNNNNHYNTDRNNHNHNGGVQVHTYQPFPPKLEDQNTPNDATTNSSSSPSGESSNSQAIHLSLSIVLSICGLVIVAASLMAVYMCRQYLCAFGRTLKKRSKEEMAKKSNGSTIVSGTSSFAGTEDSRNSMVLQNWSGPTAFSNRYVPWERDNQHVQVKVVMYLWRTKQFLHKYSSNTC